MTVQTYWIKKDWKFYSDQACTTVVTDHTFKSPHGETTLYKFVVMEPGFKFDPNDPVLWTSPKRPNIPAGSVIFDNPEYSFKDDNSEAHSVDKSCPFDLQVVDDAETIQPIPIFAAIQDVDPIILEKGDPDPGGG